MNDWKAIVSKNFSTYEGTRPSMTLVAIGGSDIGECIRDASLLALTADIVVKFSFNDTEIIVDPRELIKVSYKKWVDARA
jgi:hypothetical protein